MGPLFAIVNLDSSELSGPLDNFIAEEWDSDTTKTITDINVGSLLALQNAQPLHYRREPNPTGPVLEASVLPGARIIAQEINGNWVGTSKGWLPLNMDGQSLFFHERALPEIEKIVPGVKLRCMWEGGVGFRLRRAMHQLDRSTRPVCFNENIVVERRQGCWVGTADGWLPLVSMDCNGGLPLFQICRD